MMVWSSCFSLSRQHVNHNRLVADGCTIFDLAGKLDILEMLVTAFTTTQPQGYI